MTHTLRAARAVTAAIAFITGIVVFVSLVRTGWDSIVDFLPWVGLAYLLLACAGMTSSIVLFNDEDVARPVRWFAKAIMLAFLAAFGWLVWTSLHDWDSTETKAIFDGLAGVGLALAAWLTLVSYRDHQREKAASLKECPDCLEQVKQGARVCRYCGFRFAPVEDVSLDEPGPASAEGRDRE